MNRRRSLVIAATTLVVAALLFTFLPYNPNQLFIQPLIIQATDLKSKPDLGIVLGAGLKSDGSLSDVATERVNEALVVYRKTHIPLLFSGGQTKYGIEAQMMSAYAMAHGYRGPTLTETQSQSTYENATDSEALLVKDKTAAKTVLVITSSYHSRRAYATFWHLMSDRTVLIDYPQATVVLDNDPLARWMGLYTIAREYAANIWYEVRYQIPVFIIGQNGIVIY